MSKSITQWIAEELARPRPKPTAITNRYGLGVDMRSLPDAAILSRLDELAARWCATYQATRGEASWEVIDHGLYLNVQTHNGSRVYLSPIILVGYADSDSRYGEELVVEPSLNNWHGDAKIVADSIRFQTTKG